MDIFSVYEYNFLLLFFFSFFPTSIYCSLIEGWERKKMPHRWLLCAARWMRGDLWAPSRSGGARANDYIRAELWYMMMRVENSEKKAIDCQVCRCSTRCFFSFIDFEYSIIHYYIDWDWTRRLSGKNIERWMRGPCWRKDCRLIKSFNISKVILILNT